MLRSFKPAKCKTALNLAKSRMKLMKNKNEIQVKQMRRDLARLLQSGQDQTARIRVEHVVREEKMMVAYELIELYCELVVARMPVIESHKNCPPDLKEAITSLIFAAQRCGDIPELQDVSKHLTTKYGKEFAAAAIELRPQCGVCRTLVEKLSVKAPDAQMKLKILNAIAEEHNVKWESKWLEHQDPVPSMDLLVVPLVDKPNKIQMESLDFPIADKLPQNANDDVRSASSSQRHAYLKTDDNKFPSTAISHSGFRSESSSQRTTVGQSSGAARNAFALGGQSWNRESMNVHSSRAFASSVRDQGEGKGNSGCPALQQKHVAINSMRSSANQRIPGVQEDRFYPDMQIKFTECGKPRNFREDEDEPKPRIHGMSEKEDYRESDKGSYSEAEYNVFALSYSQGYEDKPADDPFYKETPEMKSQPSTSQPQHGVLRDEYNIFSNLNEENVNINGSVYKCSALDEEKQDITFKDQGDRDAIWESRDNFKGNGTHAKDTGNQAANAVVFDKSTSDSEFVFSPEENPFYLSSSSIKSSQKHPSFDQAHSPETSARQPFSSLEEHDVPESFRPSSNYSKLFETQPLIFDFPNPSPRTKELKDQSAIDPPKWDEVTTIRPRPQTDFSKGCQCLCTSNPTKGVLVQAASNVSNKGSSGDHISRTPSHVHPKLPDFEALTAQMKSLRANRL